MQRAHLRSLGMEVSGRYDFVQFVFVHCGLVLRQVVSAFASLQLLFCYFEPCCLSKLLCFMMLSNPLDV